MMIAAHVWDTIGAQRAGYSGALITRPGNAPLPLDGLPQPTLVAADLRQLAQQLKQERPRTRRRGGARLICSRFLPTGDQFLPSELKL